MNENENNIRKDEELETAVSPEPSDDDFVIGKGFVVEEPTKTAEKTPKKKGGGNAIKNIIWILAIIVVSVGVALAIIYVGADYLGFGFGRDGRDKTIEIQSGSATVQIAEQLKEEGIVKCPLVFRLYSRLKKYDSKYKYGVYTFSNDAGYDAIAEMLMTEGAKAQTVKGVKIPEMATVDDIAKILEDAGVCQKADFINEVRNGEFDDYTFVGEIPSNSVYYRLEGYLYPDTYDFYNYDSAECAHLAVEKMLINFEQKIAGELRTKLEDNSKYSFHELVTMASLIESEAGNAGDEDRSKVARLFFNRLEGVNWEGPKFLQTDPSTKYYSGGNKKNRRYTTYENEGLPPGPIGSPSLRSLKAAVNPTEGFTMTYFVTDSNGDFYFNDTLAAHNRIIAELKAKGLWITTTLG